VKSEIKSFQKLSKNGGCMEATQSFGIDFITRKCKADKKRADIFVRITINGEIKELSIKQQIDATNWDNSKEIVKGRTLGVKSINDHIENVRYRIKEKYRTLEDKGELITAESVKSAYLEVQSQQRGHKLLELLDYYKKIWEFKLKPGGFKNYITTIAYVRLFLASQYPSGDIYLSQLSMQLATEFEHYIRMNPIKQHDSCLGNGLAKHVQRFKRIVNWAVEDLEWIKSNPFEKYSCPLKKSKRKKLSIHQLVTIEQKTFTDPGLFYIKELFLNSCYTGFAFADAMELRECHFEWDVDDTVWCKIYRLKSEGLSPVPLLKSAAAIINKYKNHPDSIKRGAIFPLVTNQYVNRCLKIIQAACEIDIPLTFHVARHTFAKTVALKNGIPLETVQMMMGHSKITTTLIYADVDEEKIMDDMTGLDDKLDKKREIVLASRKLAMQVA
jgi:integrase/recombinase XerD